jgi:hypothetical protein
MSQRGASRTNYANGWVELLVLVLLAGFVGLSAGSWEYGVVVTVLALIGVAVCERMARRSGLLIAKSHH